MDSSVPEDGERNQRRKSGLSEDDIAEILARLPVKSLMRFKCVSKLWYSLIVSPNFISTHYTHSHKKNKVYLLRYSCIPNYTASVKTTVSFRFGDVPKNLKFRDYMESVQIVGCFNGVVCLSLPSCSPLPSRPQNYALWNPATRQLREIGDRCNGGGSGFCFDAVNNAFKVAQVRFTVTEGVTSAQINTFSTATNSWTNKNVGVPFRTRTRGKGFSTFRSATVVNGYMHWHIALLRRSPRKGVEDMYILSYDMNDEVFRRIEMPLGPIFVHYQLAAYKGSLAIFVPSRQPASAYYTEVDVWVMNDCGGANQSWCKLLTCRPSIKIKFAVGFFSKDNVDLVLMSKYPSCSLYLYDPENGETKKMSKRKNVLRTFLYSESLVSLN